jgi:hypothetical protein
MFAGGRGEHQSCERAVDRGDADTNPSFHEASRRSIDAQSRTLRGRVLTSHPEGNAPA